MVIREPVSCSVQLPRSTHQPERAKIIKYMDSLTKCKTEQMLAIHQTRMFKGVLIPTRV